MLSANKIELPKGEKARIVIITGNALRHRRFALRIQQEFGDSVLAHFQISPSKGQSTIEKIKNRLERDIGPAVKRFKEIQQSLGLQSALIKAFNSRHRINETLLTQRMLFRRRKDTQQAESLLLNDEVERLSRWAVVEAEEVTNPNGKDFAKRVATLSANILVTLGGPIYKRCLLDSVKGLHLNQHAGWSPEFKGSNTVEWALYHRQINRVGATVHLLTNAVDGGPILRREQTTLLPSDTPASCFIRTVMLGTELMIDCLHQLITGSALTVMPQLPGLGRTYLAAEMTGSVLKSIYDDFAAGWLTSALGRQRRL